MKFLLRYSSVSGTDGMVNPLGRVAGVQSSHSSDTHFPKSSLSSSEIPDSEEDIMNLKWCIMYDTPYMGYIKILLFLFIDIDFSDNILYLRKPAPGTVSRKGY